MDAIKIKGLLLAIIAVTGGCNSVPISTSMLDQTRADFVAAQSNPNVARYAQLEMKQAADALEQANSAANHNEKLERIDTLAYVAKRKIALTQEVAKQKMAETEVARAANERDQILLNQRTYEANQSKLAAEQSRLATSAALASTAEALRKEQAAQAQAAEAQARAAQLQSQLADLAAKKTERGMVVTLGDVLFGTGQSRLNPDGVHKTKKLADVLQENPELNVMVEGYADSTGSVAHNQELSERRAIAVRDALGELGVARERIAIHGYGQSYPIAPNDTAQNRQLNRRVEILLSDRTGKITQR